MFKKGDRVIVTRPQITRNMGIRGIVTGKVGSYIMFTVTHKANASVIVGKEVGFSAGKLSLDKSGGFGEWAKQMEAKYA